MLFEVERDYGTKKQRFCVYAVGNPEMIRKVRQSVRFLIYTEEEGFHWVYSTGYKPVNK